MDDDAIVTVGEPLPRLVSVTALDGCDVRVEWQAGTRNRSSEVVDLSPAIRRYRVYAPLRTDPDLFRTVALLDHRYGIAWGSDGAIDMGASTIADRRRLVAKLRRTSGGAPSRLPTGHFQ